MSEEEIQETLDEAEAPVEEQEEAAVEEAVAEMVEADGFPAELADGTVVRIVGKDGPYSIDADGNKYLADPVHGHINPVEAA